MTLLLTVRSFQAFQTSSSPDVSSSATLSTLRLHRTRQYLGECRHDLLVAMRVVNSIERNIMQAEWENWIQTEQVKCNRMSRMLNERNSSSEESRLLKVRLLDYCASCREAGEAPGSTL